MPYTFHNHTADIQMQVTGKTLKKIFEDACLGMVKLINPVAGSTKKISQRTIQMDAPDPTALLIDFLNEVLRLMQTHYEVYSQITFQTLSKTHLKATLSGYPIKAFKRDIKAATYYQANLIKDKNGLWQCIIVFDI